MADELPTTESESSNNTGPSSPSFLTLVLKTMAGLGGGVAGTLILLVIFLLASTILEPAFNPGSLGVDGGDKNPLFIFVFMAMIFLTSLGSNLLGSLFFSFVQHEKYGKVSTSMYQIFFVNVVIFIIMAPIYIILDTQGLLNLTGFLAGFHVLLAALASVMILEIIGNIRYALVGVYGVIFSLLFSVGTIMLILQFTQQNPTVVLFATLPIMWTSLGFISVVVEMVYRWIWTLYGTDFLASATEYGGDYGEDEPEEVSPPPDVSGSEFLDK